MMQQTVSFINISIEPEGLCLTVFCRLQLSLQYPAALCPPENTAADECQPLHYQVVTLISTPRCALVPQYCSRCIPMNPDIYMITFSDDRDSVSQYSELSLSVYTKNTKAIDFYKREQFVIENKQLDINY